MVTAARPPTGATVSTKPFVVSAQTHRMVSVDVLRGLVLVIMALDHTRDFMSELRFAPEDLAHTYGALFFTRFITHFCAPVFSFLAGTGAYLSTRRGKSIQQVSRFFLTRGLWLVLLELTIIDFAWGFVPWAQGGVIWILGWSMVAMALIVRLPVRWIAALGLGMIATHNLLDRINPAVVWKVLLVVDSAAHARSHCRHRQFFVLLAVRPDSMGRSHGCGVCFWSAPAAARPPQMESDTRDLRDGIILPAARVQSLRKWRRRAAVRIPTFCRPVEYSAHPFVDRDLVLQHAEVSAFSRLSSHDARALTHPPGIA